MGEKRGYGQFCPVALASEVLAQRWTPLLVRELLQGSVRFNDLRRGVPRMSPSLLAQRLRELHVAGIVERRRGAHGGWEYHLTPAGQELFPIVEEMGLWAQRWLRHRMADADHLDPDLLMWDIRRSVINRIEAGDRRFIAEFRLSGTPANRRSYWLVFQAGEVDLCYKNPGFDVDLLVAAHLRTLTQIWLGHVSVNQAIKEGRLCLDGSRRDVAAFRTWFRLSLFAPAGRSPAGHAALGALF